MNNNIFCSRKGGATVGGKFYPSPTVSQILAKQIERQNNKKDWQMLRAKCKRQLGPVKGLALARAIWNKRK